jgi:hypothetical protein
MVIIIPLYLNNLLTVPRTIIPQPQNVTSASYFVEYEINNRGIVTKTYFLKIDYKFIFFSYLFLMFNNFEIINLLSDV